MPWPGFQNFTDHDILALYTYLTAIPCLEGGPNEPRIAARPLPRPPRSRLPRAAPLHRISTSSMATGSKSADGKPLTYQ